jgi:tripartite ATP-independent transporter DctM subunit
MSPLIVGFIGIIVLFLFFFMGVPVAFAMMIVGFLGCLCIIPPDAAFSILAIDIFEQFSSYPLSVIAMFMLLGTFASASGLTRKLFNATYIWIGSLRGGLCMATISACAVFAATSGSCPATAGAMGRVVYPEMKRFKYHDAISTGVIAGSGVLGVIIPPSGVLIVYGLIAEQSIGELFVAGIFPGIILTALFILVITILIRIRPDIAPAGPPNSWKTKMRSLPEFFEAFFIFSLVIGGLYAGWFTPTQAGSAGAAVALLLGLLRRNIGRREIWASGRDALRISCMVMCLITGAIVFGHFLSFSLISMVVPKWVAALPINRYYILIIICIFYICSGCFMDSMGMIVLTIPISYPIIVGLGFDPIWFGVITVLMVEIGVITPPVGVNVYVLKGIAPDVKITDIFKGALPFVLALLVLLIILIAFPSIATYLPYLLFRSN